jgi:hypothetical protein
MIKFFIKTIKKKDNTYLHNIKNIDLFKNKEIPAGEYGGSVKTTSNFCFNF